MAKKNKPLKDWQCMECGRKMTARSAEKAMSVGCVSCGGSDIDLNPEVTL